jgi:hypothetical protein
MVLDPPDTAHLRLLECWLPLAQEISERHSWGYDAFALEALILTAAPALTEVVAAPEAHGICWYYHLIQRARRA